MMAFNNGYLLTPLTPSMQICVPIGDKIEILPTTPPDNTELTSTEKSTKVDITSVKKALRVVSTERDALTHLESLYATSEEAQLALSESISLIVSSQYQHGKIVFTGVGKSGRIAQKLVATFNSLGIVSVFLHPTEALHGDLGVIRPNDVVIMITFSGKTQELLTLLPHVPSYVPLMVMTSHLTPQTCPLLTHSSRRVGSRNILLSAPIHVSEKATFGMSAPTMSTTVALVLGDSLALAVGDRLHVPPNPSCAEMFAIHHPGGAIGEANATVGKSETRMSDLGVQLEGLRLVGSMTRHIKCFAQTCI